MAKKKPIARRPSGAAGIDVVEDARETGNGQQEHILAKTTGDNDSRAVAAASPPADKPARKAKAEPQAATGHVGVGEIRKAAAFANSVGGLDNAIALLQVLKVAKDVL